MKILERKELSVIVTCPHCGSKLELEKGDIWWYKDIDGGTSPCVTCAVCGKGFEVDSLSNTHIFPELKEPENEDKRISKEISRFLKQNNGWNHEWLTWLEKQDKQKQIWKPSIAQRIVIQELVEDKNVSKVHKTILRGMLDEFKQFTNTRKREIDDAEIEKLGESTITNIEIPFGAKDSELQEVTYFIPQGYYAKIEGDKVVIKKGKQESTNKVEPKFKVGDWVVLPLGIIAHIDSLNSTDYQVTTTDGKICNFKISKQDNYHLWTINDAKDGDVLVDVYGNIGIYEKHDDYDWTSYCCLGSNGGLRFFKLEHENENTYPATKEERELLFGKMKEEGYELDVENKCLTKKK